MQACFHDLLSSRGGRAPPQTLYASRCLALGAARHSRSENAGLARSFGDTRAFEGSAGGGGACAGRGRAGGIRGRVAGAALAGQKAENRLSLAPVAPEIQSEPAAR